MDTCRGEGRCVVAGVRSPPLPDEANPNAGRLAGDPGDEAKGDLLGGAHSVRPFGKAGSKPREVVIRGELAIGRWPKGG
jgi:hypothetical protein